MSYILEALKQSEQRRDKSDVPDLHAVQEVVSHRNARAPLGRRALLGALMVFVLLAGGIAGWWFGGAPFEEYLLDSKVTDTLDPSLDAVIPVSSDDRQVESVAVAKRQLPAPVPDKKAEPEVIVTKLGESVALSESVAPSKSEISLPEQNQKNLEALIAVLAKSQEGQRSSDNTGDSKAENLTSAIKVVERPANVPEVIEEASNEIPVDSLSDTVPAQGGTKTVKIDEAPKPPHFRELPYEIQQKLPKIIFSVHLYAPDPARRMVKINGLMKRDGDEIVTGLVLDEITSTGAIFTFQEYRFRVPAN